MKPLVNRVYGFPFNQMAFYLKLSEIVLMPQAQRVIFKKWHHKMLYLCVKQHHRLQLHIYKAHTLPSGDALPTVLGLVGSEKWLLINVTYRGKYIFNAELLSLNGEMPVLNELCYSPAAFQKCLYWLELHWDVWLYFSLYLIIFAT